MPCRPGLVNLRNRRRNRRQWTVRQNARPAAARELVGRQAVTLIEDWVPGLETSMNNDELHKEAKRLLRLEASAKRKSSDYNSRRKEATAALKPVLTSIWEAFDRGETVGGCKGPKEWCKSVGTVTYARCRQIITGTSGNEGRGQVT